jgi:hypothetical protein
MSKILFVVGEPGVGKSTLLGEAFEAFERAEVDHLTAGGPMRELLWDGPRLFGCELGRRLGKLPEDYPGTDTMSQTAIVGVDDWLRAGADGLDVIVLEGTRLMNKRFVNAALAGDHQLMIFYLYGPQIARDRRDERGSNQNPQWLKGRQTAAANFYQLCDRMAHERARLKSLDGVRGDIGTHVLPAHRELEDNARFLLAMAGLAAPRLPLV